MDRRERFGSIHRLTGPELDYIDQVSALHVNLCDRPDCRIVPTSLPKLRVSYILAPHDVLYGSHTALLHWLVRCSTERFAPACYPLGQERKLVSF